MTFDGDHGDSRVVLPAREAEILSFAAKGYTDKQISAELGISRDTVSTYWRRILLRYKAANRTEVVARAIEAELTQKVTEAERFSARLITEIHERSEAHAKDLSSRNLLMAVQSALLEFVSGTPSPEPIFGTLLAELLALTESEFGFIAEVSFESGKAMTRNLALSNISWDDDSRVSYENELTKEFLPTNSGNLVGAVLSSRAPVIVNDPATDHRSAGVPDGHPSIASFLGIPVYHRDDLIGLIGVSNRPGGYDSTLTRELTPLTATCSALMSGIKAEKLRREAEATTAQGFTLLHALLNSLDSAVMFIDEKGAVRYANDTLCKFLFPDKQPSDLIGKIGRDLAIHFEDKFESHDESISRIQQIIADGEQIKGEIIRMKDGRKFLRNFYPLRDGTARLGHVWTFQPTP